LLVLTNPNPDFPIDSDTWDWYVVASQMRAANGHWSLLNASLVQSLYQ